MTSKTGVLFFSQDTSLKDNPFLSTKVNYSGQAMTGTNGGFFHGSRIFGH